MKRHKNLNINMKSKMFVQYESNSNDKGKVLSGRTLSKIK